MSNKFLKDWWWLTKITKATKGIGATVNMCSLNEKVSGLVFVMLNIPSSEYGRDMERGTASGSFVGEWLTNVGASPDWILLWSCCEKTHVEFKSSFNKLYKTMLL